MKTVIRIKMNGKTYFTANPCYEPVGTKHLVESEVYQAVKEFDKLGRCYEEKPEKKLSKRSEDLLFYACSLILSIWPKKPNYRDIMDTLYLLIYTLEEWETKE